MVAHALAHNFKFY